MKKFSTIFLLIFVSLLSSASIDLDLPAVSTDNYGSLVNVNITVMNGTGKIYFSAPPLTGVSYQESFIKALSFIERENVNFSQEHNFYINFQGDKTSSVEGGSGGVATAIILKSLSENKQINKNIVITGEISNSGKVLPVGGIPEKLIASYFSNKTMLLIPSSTDNTEKIIAFKLSDEFNFPVYEYSEFDEVYSIYTDNSYKKFKKITLIEENNSNINELEEVEPNIFFNGIIIKMIEKYQKELNYLHKTNNPFYEEFNTEFKSYIELYEKGYSYSAGNELFLTLTSLSYLTSTYSDEEFELNHQKVNKCLNNTRGNLDNYKGNLEYYIASEVRYVKSKNMIEAYEEEIENPSIRIYAPSFIIQSDLWCESAEIMSLYKNKKDFDMESLEEFVKLKLLLYSGNTSSELTNARKYYSEGYYGASLNEIITYESKFNECEGNTFDYEWAKMMYNHALYLNTSTKYGNNSFNEISKYACAYERILKEYNEKLKEYNGEEVIEEGEINIISKICITLILILFIISITYTLYFKVKKWVRKRT